MWGLLGFVIVQSLLVSTLAYNTLPGVSRNAAMRLAMAGEDGGSATGKANVMLRKKKVKEAEDLKAEMAAEGESNPINAWLNKKERPFLVDDPVDFMTTCFEQTRGSLTVMTEYNKKAKNTGFIIGMPPPEIMGGILRDAGARAIIVSMDKRSGGTSVEEFKKFTIEQSRARKFMPKPVPVVWHDFVVDNIQIAQAAAYGAGAITLHSNFVEDMAGSIAYAIENGVTPIVCVESINDAKTAVSAGAKVLCFEKMTEDQLIEARLAMPSVEKDPSLKFIARLRPEASFTAYSEIDQAWRARDEDFQCVWPSPDAIYATGISDIYPTVLAMRAKTGRKFMSPRQFLMDRKKEGAEEFLGDILY